MKFCRFICIFAQFQRFNPIFSSFLFTLQTSYSSFSYTKDGSTKSTRRVSMNLASLATWKITKLLMVQHKKPLKISQLQLKTNQLNHPNQNRNKARSETKYKSHNTVHNRKQSLAKIVSYNRYI